MTQFWRLFTSDYVQNFVDTVSMPTSDELVETYRTQLDKGLEGHKQRIANFF